MPIGLELLFSRDLICKYLDDPEINEEMKRLGFVWQMTGKYDFLEIRAIKALEGLGRSGSISRPVGIGAHSGLVLFPAKDSESGLSFDNFAKLLQTGSEDEQQKNARQFPLLVGARLSLSPIAYELTKSYTGVLTSVDGVVAHIHKWCKSIDGLPKERVSVFRTLSSPDVVILGLPQSMSELMSLDKLFQTIRGLSLSELAEKIREISPGLDRGDNPRLYDERLPGHALAALDEFLAFRVDKDRNFYWYDTSVAMQIETALRVEVGHEGWVKEWAGNPSGDLSRPLLRINFRTDPDGRPIHIWGRHPLIGQVASLSDMVENWKVLFDQAGVRQANLVDSSTAVSFSGGSSTNISKPQSHHADRPVWELKKGKRPSDSSAELPGPIWTELEEIRENLSAWSQKFMSASQCAEFLNTLRTFRSCFLHHELASAARDLVPFFRQLSFACGPQHLADWETYREGKDCEKFSEEISDLIGHLHRAVRNRLEHRSSAADPMNPHTLEHGACKLVNSYAAMYWFVSELFARSTRITAGAAQPSEGYCNARHLAVAVASGNQGRIACREIFALFREHVERRLSKESQPVARLAQQSAPNAWTGRLLLLEVSGEALFRPELCLVHCGHEVAEFSDWLVTDQTVTLRRRLNAWIVSYFIELLCRLAARRLPTSADDQAKLHMVSAEPELPIASPLIQELRQFMEKYLIPMTLRDVQLVSKLGPIEFCSQLAASIRTRLVRLETWREAVVSNASCSIPLITRRVIDGLSLDQSFAEQARWLRDLTQEVASDIGMWAFFDHLVSKGMSHKRQPAERLRDLHIIFSSIVQTQIERTSERITRSEAASFLLRWAIQAAAVAEGCEWAQSLSDWVRTHGSSNEPHLETFAHALGANDSIDILSLIRRLPTDFPLLFPSEERSLDLDLVSELRRIVKSADGSHQLMIYYGHQNKRPPLRLEHTFQFPFWQKNDTAIGEAERSLWQVFVDTWQARRAATIGDSTLAVKQVDLALHMWAKACRLRYLEAFCQSNIGQIPDNS